MNKQKIIIISVIIGLIVTGVVLYFLFRSPQKTPETMPSQTSTFPTGQEETFSTEGQAGGATTTIEYGKLGVKKISATLTQLTSFPVSGAIFDTSTGKTKYIEKSTGHLYETSPDGYDKKQLTITTIPGIYSVKWSKDSAKALLKYFDDQTKSVRIFSASFEASTTPEGNIAGETKGIFLPSSAIDAVVSPKENKIFYLIEGETASGIVSSFENENKRKVFSSPFSDFNIAWPQKNVITLLTKPAAAVKGYLYKIDPRYKNFTKILGGINGIKGLTALYPPSGNKIIYSETTLGGIKTKIYDIKNKTTADLGMATLPEKCVFSKIDQDKVYCAIPKQLPTATYPDDWYQGLISFSDDLWEININSGTAKIISSQGDFDAINLSLNKDENYLLFINKKDSTLWSLKLNQ